MKSDLSKILAELSCRTSLTLLPQHLHECFRTVTFRENFTDEVWSFNDFIQGHKPSFYFFLAYLGLLGKVKYLDEVYNQFCSTPGNPFPIISRQNKQYKKYKAQLPQTQIILNTQIQLWTLDLDSSTEKPNTVIMFSFKKGKDEQGRGALAITCHSSHSSTPVVALSEFSFCAVTDFSTLKLFVHIQAAHSLTA